MLEKYPKSIKLLRAFGNFLVEIKFDPWAAQKYLQEADRLEDSAVESRKRQGAGAAEGAGADFGASSLVNSEVDALVVANQNGIIENVNLVAANAFGYKREEMIGRNLSILMPSPLNQQHDQFIQSYLKTGRSKVLGKIRRFEGLHRDGHLFPIQVAANRVDTARGASFVAVIRVLSEDDNAFVTTNAKGIILSFNKPFCDIFGYAAEELKGQSINTTILPLKYAAVHDKFYEAYMKTGQAKVIGTAGRRLMAKRKDGTEFPVLLSLSVSGSGENTIFKAEMAEAAEETGHITCNSRGIIVSANKYIAQVFAMPDVNYCIGKNVSMLCPAPFAEHHDTYMERYLSSGIGHVIGVGRIVPARAIDGSMFNIRLEINDVTDPKTGERVFAARIRQVDEVNREARIGIDKVGTIKNYKFEESGNDILGVGVSEQLNGQHISAVFQTLTSDR